MRPKQKVKMYIEVKPGQDEKIKKPAYPIKHIEIDIGDSVFKIRDVPAKQFDDIIDFFKLHGINTKVVNAVGRSSYSTVLGHRIVKIGKNETAIPVRGTTLEDVLLEVKNVEEELRKNGIKYERKCTWVCGM